MIECAIDLVKFTDRPFVIERPADADVVADAATRLLAHNGLRLDFRGGPTASADMVGKTLHEEAGLLDRGTGRTLPKGHFTTSIVAGPATPSGSIDQTCADALQSWKMLGHAMAGSDIEKAALFAHAIGIQQGLPLSILQSDANSTARAESLGPRRGSVSGSLLKLHAQKDRMIASPGFMQADAYAVLSLIERFSARLPPGRHDGTAIQLAALPAAADLYQRQGSAPQLGEAYPTNAEIEDLPRFEERPYGSMEIGPSYLPDTFSEASRKTAQGVHPDLLAVVTRAREISNTDFEVVPKTGGVRSEALQKRLKAAGKSKAKIGRHTIGHAIDLVPVNHGRIDFNDMKGFDDIKKAMAQAAEELNVPIQWGGNWKKLVDKPHFELDRKVYPAPGEEADPTELKVAFR